MATKGKSAKQGLPSAKDLTQILPEGHFRVSIPVAGTTQHTDVVVVVVKWTLTTDDVRNKLPPMTMTAAAGLR